jgi:hypothetical protein
MVARLIHRYSVSDGAFPEAFDGAPSDVADGDHVFFGLDGEFEPAARALRDAAGILGAHASSGSARHLIDLGNLKCSQEDRGSQASVLISHIVGRNAVPILLGCDDGVVCTVARDLFASDSRLGLVRFSQNLAIDVPKGLPRLAVGTNDLIPAVSHARWTGPGGLTVSAACVDRERLAPVHNAIRALRRLCDRVLFVLDMSVVDTGYAAGSAALNVGGMAPLDVLAAIDEVASGLPVIAVAITDLSPENDPRGHSEQIGAEAIFRLIAASSARTSA